MFSAIVDCLPLEYQYRFQRKLDKPVIEYGFDEFNKIKINSKVVKSEAGKNQSGHYTSNKMTLFGKFKGDIVFDKGNLDGIWKKYVSAPHEMKTKDYVCDLTDDFSHFDKFYNTGLSLPSVVSNAIAERAAKKNLVSLLYNMLRMHFLVNNCQAFKYDKNDVVFENENVCVLNENIYGGEPYGAPENGSVPDPTQLVTFENIPKIAGFNPMKLYSKNAVKIVKYLECVLQGIYSPRSVDVIRTACAEWRACTHIGLAHSSPALASKIYFKSLPNMEYTEFKGFDISPIVIQNTILEVVTSNRVFGDFDIALGMLTDVMFTPIPKTIKSFAWFCDTTMVEMPKLDWGVGIETDRLLGGDAYHANDKIVSSFQKWSENPAVVIPAALLLTEAVYIQLAVDHYIKKNWGAIPQNITEQFLCRENNLGLIDDITRLSSVIKREIITPYETRAGPYRRQYFLIYKVLEVIIKSAKAASLYELEAPEREYEKERKKLDKLREDRDAEIMRKIILWNIDPKSRDRTFEKLKQEAPEMKLPEWSAAPGERALLRIHSLPPAAYPVFTYGCNLIYTIQKYKCGD